MNEMATIEAVTKELSLRCSPERAFDVFTTRAAEWWPLRTHSVGGDETDTVVFEPRVGGRIYEKTRQGAEHLWGTVTAWDPPRGFACTWHPGLDPDQPTTLAVSFDATPDGTLARLVHAGWERLGDAGLETRNGYNSGWDGVLALYADAANT